MNMKELITTQARILHKEEISDNGVLILATASGVICGVPVFSDYVPNTKEEKLMMRTLSVDPKPNFLYGDETVFMLRNVSIHQGRDSVTTPWFLIRYDSVIGCAIGTR